jgi:hypothetical protein
VAPLVTSSTPATPVVQLAGPGRRRGQIHGESLRALVREGVARWKDALATAIAAPPEPYLRELVSGTSFASAIARWAPDLGEEVEGLAEGAGLDKDTVLAYQLVDEEWWFRRDRAAAVRAIEKCSVVGIPAVEGAAPLLAQNLDVPAWCDGLQAILEVAPADSGHRTLVLTYAGLIALTGVNNGPLAVCVNALLQLDHSPFGLPVAFVVRELLDCSSMAAARRYLRAIDHASGQAYSLAGSRSVSGWECGAGRCRRFFPAVDTQVLCHTNHPVAGGSARRGRETTPSRGCDGAASLPNSELRLGQLVTRTGALSGHAVAGDLATVLRSHDHPHASVCAHGGEQLAAFTAWSVIYELSRPPKVTLTAGPPCRSEYRTLELAGRQR